MRAAKLAQAHVRGLAHHAQRVEHLLPALGEFALARSLLELAYWEAILALAYEPAAAMAAIVVHVERLIAGRGRCEFGQIFVGVSIIVVGTEACVGLDVVADSGCGAHSGEQQRGQ